MARSMPVIRIPVAAAGMVWLLLAVLGVWPDAVHAAAAVVGDGQYTSETRSVGDFQAITLSGGIALRLKQAESTRVTVRGDANVLPWVELNVDAGKALRVGWKRGATVSTRSPVVVEVMAPTIRSVASAGSGDVDIDALKVARFALSVTGSGDVRARGLQHDELGISVSGSGDVKLAGQSGRVRISSSGSGDVDTAALAANEVTINIAGSGDASVQASRALTVSIAGSGHVVYGGFPVVVQAVAGSGSVRPR